MPHEYARPLVLKYGGAALVIPSVGGEATGVERPPGDPVLEELAALRKAGEAVVLVHGGGPEIDRALAERGIVTERIDGQRVTDAGTLGVVESVLCGRINERLVHACRALGIAAEGVDAKATRTLVAERMPGAGGADLGFVGEIAECHPALLISMVERGVVPVVAPLAVARDGSHAYNVNADLAAAAIAAALRARAFVLVTNVARVLRDPDDASSGIDRMTPAQARAFAATDACRSSMKPKMIAAATAVDDGCEAAYVCDAKPNALARALAGDATVIARNSTL